VGGALAILAGLSKNVEIFIAITTNGSMGYCRTKDQNRIAKIREKETYKAYQILGIKKENIFYLGFPDNHLLAFCGRRRATSGDLKKQIRKNYIGLQNSFTHLLRQTRPTRVFVPAESDLHPDHKIVYQELCISLFHANGEIWPELGQPVPIPHLYEMAVYCGFSSPPDIRILVSDKEMEKKIRSIRAFQSQKQIEAIVKQVEVGGNQEYLRHVDFQFYSPRQYNSLFSV
jgi:LmbE family N-acetylglucosaminyl deacetylase